MKSSRLLSFLRNSFFFLEWMSAIFAVLLLVISLIIAPYILSTPGRGTLAEPIYRLKFDLLPPLMPVAYHGPSGGTVELQNLRADVIVKQSAIPGTLLNFVRLRSASDCLLLILACAVFSQLRRLFDNVKRGEAFSLASVQLIRMIGWCCLGYAAAASVAACALDWLIARDLRQHLTLEHLSTGFISADVSGAINFYFGQLHLTLDVTTLGVALLAFVLAEVFRQGVRLKQENELTV